MLVCLSGLIILLLMSEIVVIENKRNVYMNTNTNTRSSFHITISNVTPTTLIGKFLLQKQTR